MRVCHVTDARDASYGGLYTATRGLVGALARTPLLDSVTLAQDGADCSRADICHAHGMWRRSAFVSLAWRLRSGKPLIVAPHGMLDEWALGKRALVKRLALATYEGLRLRKAACIHALSEAERASVERLGLGVPTFVVPNGVDLPPWAEIEAVRSAAASKQSRKTLLYLGRVDPKKGIELVLRALAAVVSADRRQGEAWTLQVCGSGDPEYVGSLARLASELGLSTAVSFPGPVQGEAKRRMLETSSAFVLTSFSEGLPMAVLEAWAYGLPSLISDQCNLSGPAAAGTAIVTTTAQTDVTRGLSELLALETRDCLDMGARARAYVERVHSWDKVCARMMDVYRWTLGEGTRPEPA